MRSTSWHCSLPHLPPPPSRHDDTETAYSVERTASDVPERGAVWCAPQAGPNLALEDVVRVADRTQARPFQTALPHTAWKFVEGKDRTTTRGNKQRHLQATDLGCNLVCHRHGTPHVHGNRRLRPGSVAGNAKVIRRQAVKLNAAVLRGKIGDSNRNGRRGVKVQTNNNPTAGKSNSIKSPTRRNGDHNVDNTRTSASCSRRSKARRRWWS